MNFEIKSNIQNGENYQEFNSETNFQSSFPTNSAGNLVSQVTTDISMGSYFGKKCMLAFWIFIILSMIAFFGGMTLLIMPLTNSTYLNNIRLSKIFAKWNNGNYSSQLANYTLALQVASIAISVNLEHLSYDPLYLDQQYYEPSLFYLNLSNNSSDNISKLQQRMGIVNLTNTKTPIGKSKSFCLSFLQTENSNASVSNYSIVSSLPYCTKQKRGFKIIPWKRVKIYNTTALKCEEGNGIYYKEICYKYLILKEICANVKVNSENLLYYRHGCYRTSNSTKFFKYKKATLQTIYNFSDFNIYVRHYKDPYVILMNFFQEEDVSSIGFSFGFLDQVIPAAIFFGVTGFTFCLMIYLLMKGQMNYKFKLL